MRRYRETATRELDPVATVSATASKGGVFTAVFAGRKALPEYLALVDRVSFRDHQACWADELVERLAQHGVFIERFYFSGDPRICQDKFEIGCQARLADLSATRADHDLLIFSDGACLFDPLNGEPRPWLDTLARWGLRVLLLTPVPPARWGRREGVLRASGFIVVSADASGLMALTALGATSMESMLGTQPVTRPYPEILQRREDLVFDHRPPPKADIDCLCTQLKTFLGITGFRWLCACAAYPLLYWDITLYFGHRLIGDPGVIETIFSGMMRLPWFRHGGMPDWLRVRLRDELPAEERERIAPILDELLKSNESGGAGPISLEIAVRPEPEPAGRIKVALAAWRSVRRRVVARKQLARDVRHSAPHSPLRDYVFMTFLYPGESDELAVMVPEVLREQMPQLARTWASVLGSRRIKRSAVLIGLMTLLGLITLSTCEPPEPPLTGDPLVAKGRELFFKETFDGNGRTCGTCHRAENNLTIDPAFIASLPKDAPLFVAEFNTELEKNFENPKLMRKRGLILENLDGTDKPGVMRGVPHVFSQRFSIDSNPRNRFECFSDTLCPRTGWSGDGAPQKKDLKSFARGAVIQHFTKTTNRKEGVDFRFPTEDEEKALEAFQLSLGRQEELKLPLPLKSAEATQGQEIFNSPTAGKCFRCHSNAGANVPPGGAASGNLNFNTGVENLPDPTGDFSQPDDGLGITPAGDGTFNTPSLVEAADTGPFFHNNLVDTIEGAVAFYNSDAFNDSPSGQFLSGNTGRAIALDATQVKAVAAFLRAINALDNIRELNKLLGAVEANVLLAGEHPEDVVKRAVNDIDDAIMVLKDGGLHPDAVQQLQEARGLTEKAAASPCSRIKLAKQALDAINQAKSLILG